MIPKLNKAITSVTCVLPGDIQFFTSQKRGANIYAEFLGGSFTCDAYHVTEPHPDGKFYTF